MNGYEELPEKGKTSDPYSDLPISKPAIKEKTDKPVSMMGALRRMREPDFVPPAVEKIPTAGELATQYKQFATGLPVGLAAGIPGIPGDIEKVARMLAPKAAGIGEETLLPTSEKIGTMMAGEPESKEEAYGRAAGTIFSPNVLSKALGVTGKAFIKPTQPTISDLSKKWESKGYILETPQLRKDQPVPSPGFMEKAKRTNEDLATKEATAKTGKETTNIDRKFIDERESAIGKEYDQIFGREFTIDKNSVDKLKEIRDFERSVDPAGSGTVVRSADNFITRWEKQAEEAQRQLILQQVAKGQITGNPKNWGQKLTTGIDSRVVRDFPNVRTVGAENLPSWFDGVQQSVNELSSNLGLKVTPKIYVGTPRREGLYGLAHPDGYVVIHDGLTPQNAVATALHEFGHQAEFQLFRQSSADVQKAVVDSFIRQRQEFPTGTKTIQQIRPVTAEKYGASARQIPEAGFEKQYLFNFSEWFAEQTSRWITQTKTPTTVVEKFFKKIADTWKAIYEKAVGYIPMTEEVNNFFRTNWKGDLLAEQGVAYIPEMKRLSPQADFKQTLPGAWVEDVTAKIDGLELQRIRSKLRETARLNKDGAIRQQARNLINDIDQIVDKTSPQLSEKLKSANNQWAATQTLNDGMDTGIVQAGKVNLYNLGSALAKKRGHPLYELGAEGKELNLVSRKEGAPLPKFDAAAAALGRRKQLLASVLGTRTQFARDIQRREPSPKKPPLADIKREVRRTPQRLGATIPSEENE